MIELTREDVIIWLSNPLTQGFYKALQKRRNDAEDIAFNSTLENYKASGLAARNTDELFAYRNLEVLNGLILTTFLPLYENLKKEEELQKIKSEEKKDDEEEEIKDDSIQNFLNNIKEVLNEKK